MIYEMTARIAELIESLTKDCKSQRDLQSLDHAIYSAQAAFRTAHPIEDYEALDLFDHF